MALITSQPAEGGYGSRVRTLVRRSITALIAVIALLGVILLGANLYVQSPSSQQQIKRHLTSAFGMPVEMVRAVFTPWGGLRIEDGYLMTATGVDRLNHTPYVIQNVKNKPSAFCNSAEYCFREKAQLRSLLCRLYFMCF